MQTHARKEKLVETVVGAAATCAIANDGSNALSVVQAVFEAGLAVAHEAGVVADDVSACFSRVQNMAGAQEMQLEAVDMRFDLEALVAAVEATEPPAAALPPSVVVADAVAPMGARAKKRALGDEMYQQYKLRCSEGRGAVVAIMTQYNFRPTQRSTFMAMMARAKKRSKMEKRSKMSAIEVWRGFESIGSAWHALLLLTVMDGSISFDLSSMRGHEMISRAVGGRPLLGRSVTRPAETSRWSGGRDLREQREFGNMNEGTEAETARRRHE